MRHGQSKGDVEQELAIMTNDVPESVHVALAERGIATVEEVAHRTRKAFASLYPGSPAPGSFTALEMQVSPDVWRYLSRLSDRLGSLCTRIACHACLMREGLPTCQFRYFRFD